MIRLWPRRADPSGIIDSELYDQDTFYKAFLQNVATCQRELVIESPFITTKRMNMLLPVFRRLRQRGVRVIINTRSPEEHDGIYQQQAADAILAMQALDIVVLYTSGHHRKIAIIDRQTVWEGSLNILSFSDSCEIMRKIVSVPMAEQLMRFIAIERYVKE